MESLLYIKSIYGQELCVNVYNNQLIGTWVKDRESFESQDIASLLLENYPLILESLRNNTSLFLGFSRDSQIFYVENRFYNNGRECFKQNVTGFNIKEVLEKLNTDLIMIDENQVLGR